MEKRESGKTITIKINGKKQSFEETRQNPSEEQGLSIDARNKEAAAEKLPQKDKEEEIITFSEAAASHDPMDESFDWILPETPEEPESKEYKMIPQKPKSKKKESSQKITFGKRKIERSVFTTIFTAVILAVILGTSFGFIMLKLVFIEKPAETTAVREPAELPEQKPVEKQAGNISLKLPAISTWLVQGGAFTNKGSAEQIAASLKDKGLSASVFENSGKSYIFLGVADTKENAKELGAEFKPPEIEETISKEMSFGGQDVSGLNDQEKAYLEAIPLLFKTMSTAVSTAALTDSVPQTLIESINQQSEKLSDGSKMKNEKIIALKGDVDGALKTISSLQKSTNQKSINSLQQQLLSILASYQNI